MIVVNDVSSHYSLSFIERHHYHVGKFNIMANLPTFRIRTRRKYYRLIFTGIMALMMSLIISSALLLVKVGFVDGFFMELMHSWGLAFVFAWPSAYICAYLVQEHVLSRIEFY